MEEYISKGIFTPARDCMAMYFEPVVYQPEASGVL
jgi:hypothetical protein